MSRRRVLEPTGAREHVRGPDVIPTATVKGAREGARVGIMSVGARELRVGRPSRDKTRIPLMSVSGFNNLQSRPYISFSAKYSRIFRSTSFSIIGRICRSDTLCFTFVAKTGRCCHAPKYRSTHAYSPLGVTAPQISAAAPRRPNTIKLVNSPPCPMHSAAV